MRSVGTEDMNENMLGGCCVLIVAAIAASILILIFTAIPTWVWIVILVVGFAALLSGQRSWKIGGE